MKQKKIGTTLYVFDTTAYQITEDTDAAVIKIQLECIPAFEVLNESLKDKFEPINYKLFCVKHPEWADYLDDYTVSVSVTGNGAVSASPTSADEGEEITLTVTPESGYELNTLTAASGGTAITITDNKFTMPAGNVTVTATFQLHDFSITCNEAVHGSVSAPATANLGDTITITTTPDSRYGLDTLTVMCGEVPVSVSNSQFTMPAGDVTITATFKQVNFDITAFSSIGGTVNAYSNLDRTTLITTADAGATVYLWYTQADGYRMSSIGATCGGDPITLDNNRFTMPEGDVTLTGTFVAIDYANEYFTVESVEDSNSITIRTESEKTFEVSLDGGTTWIQATGTYSTVPTLDQYDRLLVRATGDTFTYTNDSKKESIIVSDKDIKIYGNIMSLLYGSSFTNQTSLPADTTENFKGLFRNCGDIVDAKHLILPATTLADYCYEQMFYGCISLTTAPSLPATTLANSCYKNMFYDCTILTTAPELPATILPNSSYYQMFMNCSSLNYIKCLTTDTGTTRLYNWVSGVAATGTFVKNSSVTNWPEGNSGIPTGWTVEDYTPSV